MRRASFLCLLVVLSIPSLLAAHPGHGGGFANGVAHPFTGLDHILAMLAVGMWSIQLAPRMTPWRLGLVFLTMMAVGGVLARLGFPLPVVEAGILASVLILGTMVFFALRLPPATAMVLVGGVALFHGYAHLAEIPSQASAATYMAGLLLASLVLIAVGAGFARVTDALHRPAWLRFSAAAITLAGVILAMG